MVLLPSRDLLAAGQPRPSRLRIRVRQVLTTRPMAPTASRASVDGSGTTSAVTLSVSVCPPAQPLRSCSSERLNWYWPEKLPSCDVFKNKSYRTGRRAGGQVGERHRIRAEDASRIGKCHHGLQSQAGTVRGGQILDLELEVSRAAAKLQGAKVQIQRPATARKGGRRMVQHRQRCGGRLREVGGSWIAAGERNGRDAKLGGSGRDGAGLACARRRDCPWRT